MVSNSRKKYLNKSILFTEKKFLLAGMKDYLMSEKKKIGENGFH